MITIGVPPSAVDFLNFIDGLEFSSAWERRVIATADGIEAPFLSREDLKATKRASGRPKDLYDIAVIEENE